MRRSVPFVVCVGFFALSTGLTLLALAQTLADSSIPVHNRSAETAAANVALVRRFYSAAAMVLTTGDAAFLDATIAPDLTEHPARPGTASGRDGFARSLLALRATFPGVKLVVDDVRAVGEDQVLARVHTEDAGSGEFLGRLAPASIGQWGPLEVWRLADGQLVERWGDLDPATLLPLGRAPISVDALGPGHRRMTVTQLTIEPGARLAVDNGQAIRVFAVDAGTLTISVERHLGGTVAVVRGSATPAVSGLGTSYAVVAGDRVVTEPEAKYTLANAGPTPVIAIVIVLSNTLDGEWPLDSSAAMASWTVAAMPQALGGVLPSPAGFSAHILATNVEVEIPEQSTLALGWVFLAPEAMLVLPAGDGMMVTAVVEGWIDLALTGDASEAKLASGEWRMVPVGMESLWRAADETFTGLLVLIVGQEESTQ